MNFWTDELGLPASTLIIGGWSSSCANCGKEVLPSHETHDVTSGYSGGDPACGIRFTHVYAEYGPMHEAAARGMRPDLEFIPYDGGGRPFEAPELRGG